MLEEAFSQVKDQMGSCGIACATCNLGNGTVAETAVDLKQKLQAYGVSKWAPQVPGGSDIDFKELEKSLDWVHTYTRCFGCEQGGGPPDCPIRTCAKERGYELCSQCPDLQGCTKFDWLKDYAQQLKNKLKEQKTKEEYVSEAINSMKK